MIETLTPLEVQQRFRGNFEAPASAPKTLRRYARVRVVDTGVRDPSSTARVPVVPFHIRLDPLYFGVLPPMVVQILSFLFPVVGFAAFFVVPRIYGYVAGVAKDAKKELAPKEKSE